MRRERLRPLTPAHTPAAPADARTFLRTAPGGYGPWVFIVFRIFIVISIFIIFGIFIVFSIFTVFIWFKSFASSLFFVFFIGFPSCFIETSSRGTRERALFLLSTVTTFSVAT